MKNLRSTDISVVEENEGVLVKAPPGGDAHDVENDPERHDHRLADKEHRRAEEPGKRLGLERKPIPAEDRREMQMLHMEAHVMIFRLGPGG